jgi:hypothetical protein
MIATHYAYYKTAMLFSSSLRASYNTNMAKRRYLKIGDIVVHRRYPHWGRGEVIEEQFSELEGGFCMVRILFDDKIERAFINDLENECCCYFAGIRIA